MFPTWLGNIGQKILSKSRYPSASHVLINELPVGLNIESGDDVEISNDVYMRGDIEMGDSVRLGPESHLDGNIKIGRGTNLVEENEVIGDVEIGNYCAIARETRFQGHNHDMKHAALQMRVYWQILDSTLSHVNDGPIKVGNDVWFGAGSTVLPSTSIGSGAIIGAESVVTDDVPPYAKVAGVPAEIKGWRFSETIREQLLNISWWDWSEQRMKKNKEFFEVNLDNVEDLYERFDFIGE